MRRLSCALLIVCAIALVFFTAGDSEAVPTFARKYKTSCTTCHYAFPRLNNFGKAFLNNGMRYPGDDKEYAKEEAVSLGAENYKKVFPNAIWPADIPGAPVISFRAISRVHFQPSKNGKAEEFSFETPHELEAFMAGTIGDEMSFFFELEWEHVGEFGYGGWLDYMFSPQFHARLGNIDYLPVHDGMRFTREHYNYYDYFGGLDASGIEIWGAANGPEDRGGLVYSVAAFNGENDGGDNIDKNSNKDVMAKASFKIGGMGVVGSTTASETSAFWKDNSMTLGGFAQTGKMSNGYKTRNVGGNADFFFENLNVFGLYMISSEKAPSIASLTAAAEPEWNNSNIAFLEADYVVYPWLIPLLRFEYAKEDGAERAKKQLVPGIVIMARANVKFIVTGRHDLNGDSDRNRYNLQAEVGF